MLSPLLVANPFAKGLTFLDDRTRTRRDHVKYLTLIRSIALLHQYQRPVKTINHQGKPIRYIEVTLEDIETANRLAHEVLGRSLDELPPQTRRLLDFMIKMVAQRCAERSLAREDYHFSRKEVREYTGWTEFQVRIHLSKLAVMECVLAHHGKRGQSFEYELLYDGEGKEGASFLIGLKKVEQLKKENGYDYDGKFEHCCDNFEGSEGIERALNEPPSSLSKNGQNAGFIAISG
jgi:hypothetical protein